MNEYQPYVGRVLSELRHSRGLTLESAAADAGIDKRTLQKIERGQKVRSGYAKICKLLGGLDDVKRRAIEKRNEGSFDAQARLPKISNRYQDTITRHLNHIDEAIQRQFKTIYSPTRTANANRPHVFSSRKLITSLATLGIPVETSLHLLDDLPDLLRQLVNDTEELSTNHVRSAVARLIERLPAEAIVQTEFFQLSEKVSPGRRTSTLSAEQLRFDWAARYARRYGAGERAIQVLQRDGTLIDLNYPFLKDVLFPHVLRRLLGESFSLEKNGVIRKEIVANMARGALEEFKRLGLYTIRYKTALRLAEDLAMHPPHPWLVTEDTRQASIEYDFAKSHENIARLNDPAEGDHASVAYRYMEALRHISSAILGVYSGYLGNRETSPLHLLYATLALENDNRVLWERCQLRLIDGDLQAISASKQEFIAQLKRYEMSIHDPPAELAKRCARFLGLAERLRDQRRRMEVVEKALHGDGSASDADLLALARETVIACLGGRRLKTLQDSSRSYNIGMIGSVRTEDSLLQNRSASVIFLICKDPSDIFEVGQVLRHAQDQLAAHQASRTVIVLCVREAGEIIYEKMAELRKSLGRDELIAFASLETLRLFRTQNVTIGDIIDEIFM